MESFANETLGTFMYYNNYKSVAQNTDTPKGIQWRGSLLTARQTKQLARSLCATLVVCHWTDERAKNFLKDFGSFDESKERSVLEIDGRYMKAIVLLLQCKLETNTIKRVTLFEQAEALFSELERGLPAPWSLGAMVLERMHMTNRKAHACPFPRFASFSVGNQRHEFRRCTHGPRGKKIDAFVQWSIYARRSGRLVPARKLGWTTAYMFFDGTWATQDLQQRVMFDVQKDAIWRWRMDMTAEQMNLYRNALQNKIDHPSLCDEVAWRAFTLSLPLSVVTVTKHMDNETVYETLRENMASLASLESVSDLSSMNTASLLALYDNDVP
jgi:hypothetical protein